MNLYKWFLLSIKMQIKNYKFWSVIIVSLFLLNTIKLNTSNEILIINQSENIKIDVDNLNVYDDYKIVELYDVQDFKNRINNGDALCGFIVKADAYDKLLNSVLSDTVDYYYQDENPIAASLKEKIYAEIFEKYSEISLRKFSEKYFDDRNEEIFNFMYEDKISESANIDLISTNIRVNSIEVSNYNKKDYGYIISMIIIISLIISVEILDDRYKNYYFSMSKKESLKFKFVNISTDVLLYIFLLYIYIF